MPTRKSLLPESARSEIDRYHSCLTSSGDFPSCNFVSFVVYEFNCARCKPNHLFSSNQLSASLNPDTHSSRSTMAIVYL